MRCRRSVDLTIQKMCDSLVKIGRGCSESNLLANRGWTRYCTLKGLFTLNMHCLPFFRQLEALAGHFAQRNILAAADMMVTWWYAVARWTGDFCTVCWASRASASNSGAPSSTSICHLTVSVLDPHSESRLKSGTFWIELRCAFSLARIMPAAIAFASYVFWYVIARSYECQTWN